MVLIIIINRLITTATKLTLRYAKILERAPAFGGRPRTCRWVQPVAHGNPVIRRQPNTDQRLVICRARNHWPALSSRRLAQAKGGPRRGCGVGSCPGDRFPLRLKPIAILNRHPARSTSVSWP